MQSLERIANLVLRILDRDSHRHQTSAHHLIFHLLFVENRKRGRVFGSGKQRHITALRRNGPSLEPVYFELHRKISNSSASRSAASSSTGIKENPSLVNAG